MIYKPSPLILNENEPVRCLFSKKIRPEEIQLYDGKTYIFDAVYVNQENTISLFGPPILNLKKEPGLPQIEHNGADIPYSIKTTALRRFTEWTLPVRNWDPAINPVLDFRFKKIPDRSIQLNSVSPFPRGSRVLTAIQKNNEIRWICDWFHHYKSRFDVEYLVLYDNGSEKFGELSKELPEQTILVDWSFPYGPTFSHDNKFAQVGALNHCRRVFGRDSIIFNFDIDELLFVRNGDSKDILGNKNVIYFSSFDVPQKENLPEQYSFHSYEKRSNKPRYYARKYIFKASAATGLLPHYVQTQHFRPWAYFIIFLRKLRNRNINTKRNAKAFRVRFISMLLRILTNDRKEPSLSVESAYFLHFLGITTNWKSLSYRETAQKKRKDLVDDPLLIALKRETS